MGCHRSQGLGAQAGLVPGGHVNLFPQTPLSVVRVLEPVPRSHPSMPTPQEEKQVCVRGLEGYGCA